MKKPTTRVTEASGVTRLFFLITARIRKGLAQPPHIETARHAATLDERVGRPRGAGAFAIYLQGVSRLFCRLGMREL
jgi:hypothetical protein